MSIPQDKHQARPPLVLSCDGLDALLIAASPQLGGGVVLGSSLTTLATAPLPVHRRAFDHVPLAFNYVSTGDSERKSWRAQVAKAPLILAISARRLIGSRPRRPSEGTPRSPLRSFDSPSVYHLSSAGEGTSGEVY